MTAWIDMVPDAEATPELQAAFDVVRAPAGTVDNVMRVHSLRPHTMLGHHKLYMAALHNAGNSLPDWLLETVASYVSILNGCDYSLTNHFANARHCMADDARADAVWAALHDRAPERVFEGRDLAIMRYTEKLTVDPAAMAAEDVEAMRAAGTSDGEILEVNQVCGYFAYANRLLNGLGVTLQGDVVGYYNAPDDGE